MGHSNGERNISYGGKPMPKIEVNGTILHVHKTGKGIPLVLIHPPLLTSETFNYQKAQLSDEFKVITFDIRGHGESQPSKRKLTYPLIAEDIRQLLDALDIEKAYICGYSCGGSIVLEALLAYPDRCLGGIIVSGMAELSHGLHRSEAWLAAKMSSIRPLRSVVSSAISIANADMRLTFQNLRKSSMHGDPRNQQQYFEYSRYYNCIGRLPYIHKPVLLIYGQNDTTYHSYGHLLHERLPNSSLYFIKDGHHHIPIKHASRMNDLIRLWVQSLEDQETDRDELDLEIARKLNPEMYMRQEEREDLPVS
jgi:pimeloyl-ACP methyl ester carboxylesterase